MAFTSLYPAQGLQNFVDEASNILTAVNGVPGAGQFRSQIINRAPITDISQNLKPAFGIERIQVQQVYALQNEFGNSVGEVVFGALNDDRGLVRCVGMWVNVADSLGSYASSSSANTTDFVEIVFYGTGLNLLGQINATARDFRYTLDGGSESANFLPNSGTGSALLNSRGNALNQIFPVVSGLSQGLHTIKIRNNSSGAELRFYGYEVLNESSNLKTNAGSAFIAGKKNYLSAVDTQSPTSSFTNSYGSAGSRGGHVLVYLASDGTIKKDIQYTDVAQNSLTSTDHSNEEVARTYYYREFGSNRSDDFTTNNSSAAARAFTLDDNVTTLLSPQVHINTGISNDGVVISNTFTMTFIFVGTGLDVVLEEATLGAGRTETVAIDGGSSLGTIADIASGASIRTIKIVSGLPYGTHVVKFTNTTSGDSKAFKQFIVYQPKKPALPAGAIELGDYNVLATYVANATAGLETIATGVVRKSNLREVVYTGTWTTSLSTTTAATGWDVGHSGGSNGEYCEYTFYGTGFELRARTNGNSTTTVVSLQALSTGGSLLAATVANFPTIVSSVYGTGWSYTAGTATLSQNGATTVGGGLSINSLPLGLYKIRFTDNNAANGFEIGCLDIITPIHSQKSNLFADLQNSLLVGSCALSDNRQIQPLKLPQSTNKYRAQAVGINSDPTTTSTSFVPMPDLALTVPSRGSWFAVSYAQSGRGSTTTATLQTQIYIDGVAASIAKQSATPASANNFVTSDRVLVFLSPGTHKIDLYWAYSSGTGTTAGTQRSLTVEEL